jgi:hypothetical protein
VRRIGKNRTGNAQRIEQPRELILDDIREGADDQQGTRRVEWLARQARGQRGETGILALRERRLDAAAGIAQYAHVRRVLAGLTSRGAFQIYLDDFGGARSNEKQQFHVRTSLEQPLDHAVEFVVDICDPGEIALVHDRSREARLGENHDAGG